MSRPSHPGAPDERRLPPVTAVVAASMACVVIAGIYLASHLPKLPPLALPAGFVVGGGALLVAAVTLVARLRSFAWPRFFTVARYALLAYLVITGLLAYVFIDDGTRGGALTLLIASLAIFAVDVPLLLAFTVARYQAPEPSPAA